MKYYCKQLLLISIFSAFTLSVTAQQTDSVTIRSIYDHTLTQSDAYELLRELCKSVGHRLSGSANAEKAVQWGKSSMDKYGFDAVYLQEIMVPHWVRGDKEVCKLIPKLNPKAKQIPIDLKITTLGGSVGTNGSIQAEVVEVQGLKELDKLGKEKIQGKIVFYNRPMEAKLIDTFNAYGGCVDQRGSGASEAAKYGAIAVLVRSMTLATDNHPHTGSLFYADSVAKIPGAALSTEAADKLHRAIEKEKTVSVMLDMNCKLLPDVKSHNVIAEIKGSETPEKVIVIGGHLDSWDIGEGAHDDGAGIVHSMQTLITLKKIGIKPQNTIRCILYMNEENGNRGGKTYAEQMKKGGVQHLAAIESDRGGFAPRGFSVDGSPEQLKKIQSWAKLFKPYQLHLFEKGYGGVDIGPLKDGKVCLIGLVPDSQRYFDHHHAETDVFEAVNKRELELGAAAMTSLVYLIDKYGFVSTENEKVD